MLMAADQWRKRLNGVNIVGCTSRQQHRVKNKNSGSLQNDLSMKPHISLEWDGNQRRVVARKEQIGISWRCSRPFIDSVPRCHNILADVFSAPQEIFELEDLAEVLSYEVWQTHLSESERNYLVQFLPKGPEAQKVVQELLAGDNFHFGNPFVKWGASLCSGNLHPDAVIHQERCLKADNEAHYSELLKYHNDMVGYLLKLKDRWASCKDPEKEIVHKIWRSRKDEKRIFSHANDYRFCELDENVATTSESCSWVADEKACSSDNQNSSMMKGGELRKRLNEKGVTKDKCGSPLIASDDALKVGARSRKGDRLQKRNMHRSDGAKYMSYFKISKKQHQLVKSMKKAGKSIQSRYLNRVLGDLDSLHVQPYEVFVEEECKKLHEHWLQLTNQDVPKAFAIWRERKLEKQQMIKFLEQDMKEKLKLPMEEDEEKENSDNLLTDKKDNQATSHGSSIQDDEESDPDSPRNQPALQISSTNDDHEANSMDMDSGKNIAIPKSGTAPSGVSEYLGILNTTDVAATRGVPLSSSRDAWPSARMAHAYYDSTPSHVFTSASELSTGHPQANEAQQTQMIDLESDLREKTGKDLLHRHANDGSFSSYPNQDRNDVLQSFFKEQQMISYTHGQKQMRLDFQPPNNVMMEDGQFPEHFHEQPQLSLRLEEEQKRRNEVYVHQNMSDNFFSGGRYLIPRQEQLPPVNVQDWAVNPVRMSAPVQPHLNGRELLSPNWFSSEHQARSGWTGSDGSCVTDQIGGGSNTDQSLFSVLNQFRSGSHFNSMGSTEQLLSSRNYGMVSGAASRISNVLSQTAHPLECLNRHEAANSVPVMSDDMGWINLPNQNPALHDPMGKPFLGSWNH